MELVPAPSRVFKTWSMIIVILLGSADALYLLMSTFGELELLSKQTVIAINAAIAFLLVPIRLIQQQIPTTNEQKKDLVESAAEQPMKSGEAPVVVKVDERVVNPTTIPKVRF